MTDEFQTFRETIDLSGPWRFALDPEDVGIERRWFERELEKAVSLPGTTDENERGDRNDGREPDHLTRVRSYEGAAWYQRTVDIPDSWADRRVELTLERTRSTRIWVDSEPVGRSDALSAPQVYDLTDALDPGEHVVTICVDNTADVLSLPGVQRSHMATEHTQTNWNGIVGEITLHATAPVWVDDVRVSTDAERGEATVEARIHNRTSSPVTGRLTLDAYGTTDDGDDIHDPAAETVPFTVQEGETTVTTAYDLGDDPLRWDEFSPATYDLSVTLDATAEEGSKYTDATSTVFGLCDFEVVDTQFEANGRTTFLRGNVDCCIFPETGYAPTGYDEWYDFLATACEYGINHYRFHSWCPPEAAFEAADDLGIYLQPELPIWNNATAFEDDDAAAFFRAEAERILDAYGDHPSFVMFALGNELQGDPDAMAGIVDHCREYDPRHCYATGSYNFLSDSTLTEADDYWTTASVPPDPRDADSGRTMVRGANVDDESPATTHDYAEAISDIPIPVVSHEIGQYQVYPDYDEIDDYDGVLHARNLAIARDHLEAHRMLDLAEDFHAASGQLAVRCYREDVEAAIRTPGMGGFQLLDLQDFPGQGTALVGILDAFMRSKGLIDPEEWRAFCAPTVALARLESRTWTTSETFEATAQIAHYGEDDLAEVTPTWALVDGERTVASGTLPGMDVPQGEVATFGAIEASLNGIDAPTALTFELSMEGTDDLEVTNSYDMWVYPADVPGIGDAGSSAEDAAVTVRRAYDEETRDLLADGESVLLVPRHDDLRHSVEGTFQPDFWSYALFKRNAPPGTMGPLFDPDHPLFEAFPTGGHGDWQWWHLLKHSRPVVLDDAPGEYRPLVQMVDNIERNQKLGLVFETPVGDGALLVCAMDLFACADDPAARQFARALMEYAASDQFDPDRTVPPAVLEKLFAP